MAERVGRGWSPAGGEGQSADVVLLRHGETRLSPERRFSGVGRGDPGLSTDGYDQAHRAAQSSLLRGIDFAEVLTSPMRRCQETAQIVAASLGVSVRVDDDLREMDFGDWEELTFDEVRMRYPDDLQRWKASTSAAPTGSTECFDALCGRIGAAAGRIAASYAGASLLAVTHVTPIKAFVANALGAPPAALYSMELAAACFSRIAYAGAEASVQLVNETSHLR